MQNIYKKAESYLVLSKFITPYVGHATISPTYMKTDICGKEMPVEY
ncbi:MAG: hypothetical protein KA436_05300 [Oligoflexales bacterium]|nr:hypothetical protein [Oligoflexales bacterium]